MLKLLIRKQMMEIFRSYFYNAKKNTARSKASTILMFLFFGALMTFLAVGMFGALSFSLSSMIDAGFAWFYFALMGLIALLLGAFGAIFSTYTGLYLAKDNDLLLAMPISIHAIMTSRLLSVYLMGLMYSAVVTIPAVVIYFFHVPFTVSRLICALLWILLVSLIVMVLSCLLGYAVARLSLKIKRKSLVTTVLALVGIGLYYFLYFRAIDLVQDMLVNVAIYGEKIKGAAYGLYLFGQSATGDWLALDGADAPDAVIGGTEEGFIADVYYRRSALITAEAAEILGFTQDAEEYRALADHIRDELLEEYYTPSGRCAVMTQTGQILSVQNDLGKKEKHAAVLVKLLENNNRKLKTGFVGTPLLADALTKIGRDDLAYALLFNEEYPGWLYEVNLGATTIWERWNSVGADGLISSTGMNSLNHYSYGAIVQWSFERCAGLKPLEPGFASAQIAPVPHVKLGSIHMAYRSAAGEWKIDWQLQGRKTLCLQISVPFGAQAQVVLPDWDGRTETANPLFEDVRDGICHVGSGTYAYTYEMTHAPLGLLSVDSTCGELLKKPGVLEMLLEKMPSVGPIPLRSAQDRSLRSVAEQYSIPQEVIEEMDHQIEILTK